MLEASGLSDSEMQAVAVPWATRDGVTELAASRPRSGVAAAGTRHLVPVTRTRERLAEPDYDVETLATLMRGHGLITLLLGWPELLECYHAHNPFADCGVRTPANVAAAAALAGYLRVHGKVREDAAFIITQGVDMGRPSEIVVRLTPGEPGARVSGAAHPVA